MEDSLIINELRLFEVREKVNLADHSEVKSDNARNVILSYRENVYFVNKVNVQIQEGNTDKLQAIFHAKRLPDNEPEDLNIEINQKLYDMLIEYAKMDKFDLILILQIQGDESKWCLMSENWLKNQATGATPASSRAGYVV